MRVFLWGILTFKSLWVNMGMFMAIYKGRAMLNPSVKITKKMLNLIAGIDEFKGEWKAIGNLAPEGQLLSGFEKGPGHI